MGAKIIRFFGVFLAFSILYIDASSAKVIDLFDKVYLKAGAGVAQFDKFRGKEKAYIKSYPKANPIYNIGVGYKFNDQLRTDLNLQYAEIKYRTKGASKNLSQNIKTTATFINGYYDIDYFCGHIVPYVTVGIGIGRNDSGDLKQTDMPSPRRKGKNTTNFIWNIGVGAKYDINKNFALDLGYRYMDLGKIKTEDSIAKSKKGKLFASFFKAGKQNIRGHEIIGSVVYNF